MFDISQRIDLWTHHCCAPGAEDDNILWDLGGGPGGAISALSGRTDAPTEHRVTFISSQMLALLVKQIKTTSGASVLSFVSISGLKTNGTSSSGHMSLAAGT